MTSSVRFAYVGSRTNTTRKARGEGLSVFAIKDGAWSRSQIVDIADPSFLALSPSTQYLYAAQGDGSTVSAFTRDLDRGELTLLNTRPSHGLNGAHIAVDPTGRFAVIANHLTGEGFESNIAVFPIGDDGALGEASDVHKITGKNGPNRREQPFAKPHQVQFSPNGKFMAMADKGLDEVFVFALSGLGILTPVQEPPVRLRWGSAPRHLSFHPTLPYLYILTEIDSTIVTAHFDAETGAVTPFQVVLSISDDFALHSFASHITVSPDGRHVYASNRGQDTIAVLNVDPTTGRLTPSQFAPSGGHIPRYFAFTPDHHDLYVANEASDAIVHFDVAADGRLFETGPVADAGTPTCIVLA